MKILQADKLGELAAALAAAGYRVIAPLREGEAVRLAEWSPGKPIVTDVVPVNSAKDVLFPPSEVIGRYQLNGNDFVGQEVRPEPPKTVLLCGRSCDAAALAALDTVFNWDYKDEFYNARRAATTIVTLVCTSADEQCFCTTVGGSPDSQKFADAMLRSADGGARLILEPLTEKGQALAQAGGSVLAEGPAAPDAAAQVGVKFDADAVTQWCRDNFDSPLWVELSLPCLGCGACAYMCPTCHCFDIQDEATRAASVRVRNWDSCGFGLFTLHASGHNPRHNQSARWRQRVLHKFSYFPERFGIVACTGCGRCARLCQAGMAMSDVCRRIDEASKVLRT